MDINYLDRLKAEKYPEVAELIRRLQAWDRKATANSIAAGTYLILYHKLYPYYYQLPEPKIIPPTVLVKALKDAKVHMLKHFGTTEVKLGEYQKLVRGDKALPVFGLNDVVTAMSSVPYKDGKVKVVAGESYIELVKLHPMDQKLNRLFHMALPIILNPTLRRVKWNCTHNSKRKK